MGREVYMSTMYCPVSKQITQLSPETQTRAGKSLVKCHASEPSWPTLAFQNLEPNTAAKLWAETQMPSSSKQRLPCALCQASAGAHLGSSSRAKAGVCFSQLICDVPFYSWTLCPSQLTLELNFPTATWTRWLQKCSLLSVSPGKPAFSSTCSKKDGWTEHSSGSSLGWQSLCLKGAVADAMENLCRHGWLAAMQGRRKDLNIRCLLHQSRTGRSANPAPAQAAVALTWQNKTRNKSKNQNHWFPLCLSSSLTQKESPEKLHSVFLSNPTRTQPTDKLVLRSSFMQQRWDLSTKKSKQKTLCSCTWGNIWLSCFPVVGQPANPILWFMSLICQGETVKGPPSQVPLRLRLCTSLHWDTVVLNQ